MNPRSSVQIHIGKDPVQLCKNLAEWIIECIADVLRSRDHFNLVLSGGNTPRQLYELLAQSPYREKIAWSQLHIFFGDERYVPFDDKRNNGRMAQDALLNHVAIPSSQIHYLRTDLQPEESAAEYETILKSLFSEKEISFDLVLLGMGDDGHTLSLFPGYEIIFEKERWVKSVYNIEQKEQRITLTAPIVNKSASIAFLVTGIQKSTTIKSVIQGNNDPEKFPCQIIKPITGSLHWFIDEAAASLIS
ncbi:MAG: 6-phosphogluconolactonase [Chitinophagaceae bacterium]|nr:6-phosphogluconolactonase [Chitinophagaceae bacterium]